MTINTYDTVVYTALFIVPGFMIDEIVRTIIPQKKITSQTSIIHYLMYSIINLALWNWLYFFISKIKDKHEFRYWVLMALFVILTSAISGIVIGVIKQKEIVRKMLLIIKIETEHQIPTAWDYKFYNTNEPRWVIVTLTSGRVIRGLYGNKSLSSSDSQFYDLYLEEIYELDSSDNWMKADRTDGVWINSKEICVIEFKK